ncbi:phosphatase [Anaeramoeba ignava]|uniref:Phosphatase n=1 Tax=Anaeramoeba ignava TaxID=1746090 RepID=A0A9Q0LX80_ANAIG|nr:phosphatase [Anaeramoeba ignava]
MSLLKFGKKKKSQNKTIDFSKLDISYITKQIIVMSFPATKIEGKHRHKINDIANYLDEKHLNKYKVYNLCSEKSYDTSKFHKRVEMFPIEEDHPPSLEMIISFCKSVEKWILEEKDRLVVIHSKTGNRRTSVMVCCYLLYNKTVSTAEDAISFFETLRSTDNKEKPNPSQIRYIHYFEDLVKNGVKPKKICYFQRIVVGPLKKVDINSHDKCPNVSVHTLNGKLLYSSHEKNKEGYVSVDSKKKVLIILPDPVPLIGDYKITFYNYNSTIFVCCFNTSYIKQNYIKFRQDELDSFDKKHQKKEGVSVELFFSYSENAQNKSG